MQLKRFSILFFCLTISIVGASCVKPVTVEGTAMKPTLNNNDRIFLNTYSNEPNRGDIVAFLYPKDKKKWFIKRVIGLPTETVEIKNGRVIINGEELNESYVDHNLNQSRPNHSKVTVPKDNFFVLGDNRDNSSDSRVWGTVSKDLIQGIFLYRYAEIDDPYKQH